ncbi:type VI secretion system baseplate subunit TssK [Citrobacter sp. ESBL3]|uniref:type VI secretion system baseplate subunit TssK n=1 Tax=Citrobacter sp. ESBL3 TaxID=3077326 RepID=UPI002FCB9C16
MKAHFQPIYWHSGLYLQPQHFQLSDIQQQYWDYRYHQIHTPFSWGMIRFELDPQALLNHELSASQAVLLFPDGTLVDCDVNGILPTRSLRWFAENYTEPVPFCIGLRRFHPGQANVAEGETLPVDIQGTRRWTLLGNARVQRDLFGEGPDADVQTLRYHLRFFLGDEVSEATGYSLLPAGVLGYNDGEIVTDEQAIVPCLSLQATPAGRKWLNDFCQTLLSKIRRLETLKAEGSALTKCTPDEFRALMLILQILCRYAAVLEQYRQVAPVHPWQIFITLQQLNAELLSVSTVNNGTLVELLRTPWDHQKPAQALLAVTAMFDKLISQLLNISGSRARLLPDGEGRYMASLEHIDAPVGAEIYLCLHSAHFFVDDKHPVDEENSRLCSPGQLENLINYSLPGIPLSVVQRLPHNLSVRDDTYCFRLDTHSQIWRDAWRDKRVIFHWGDAPEDLQVEILWLGEA